MIAPITSPPDSNDDPSPRIQLKIGYLNLNFPYVAGRLLKVHREDSGSSREVLGDIVTDLR